MRIFLNVPLNSSLLAEIAEWEKAHNTLPLRWTPAQNLHITLLPPWETNNPEQEIFKLSKLPPIKLPKLVFGQISFGPNPKEPRLVWATGPTPPELTTTVKLLSDYFSQPLQSRKFTSHITLSRFRPDNLKFFPTLTLNEAVEWEFQPEKIVLYESILKPSGVVYNLLAEHPVSPQ